jgi:hypothetical protein
MANSEHLNILKQGVEVWNRLRAENQEKAERIQAILDGADFSGEIPETVGLDEPNLIEANLTGMNLSGANLRGASLQFANLNGANLSNADLTGADLRAADLLKTDLSGAILVECAIWGVAAWGVKLDGATQRDLRIAHENDPVITVDDIEVAQFIHLLLDNKKIRSVIDTVTTKTVLILGRFTPDRKAVLDALREELRRHDYVPILFDFDKPLSRNLKETVSTLAHMAKFVIADITDPVSIPQELERIVPGLPSVPVQPLILSSEEEYGMFESLKDYPWLLEPYRYENVESLIASLDEAIAPARDMAKGVVEKRRTSRKGSS